MSSAQVSTLQRLLRGVSGLRSGEGCTVQHRMQVQELCGLLCCDPVIVYFPRYFFGIPDLSVKVRAVDGAMHASCSTAVVLASQVSIALPNILETRIWELRQRHD